MAPQLQYQSKVDVFAPAAGPATPSILGWYAPLSEPVIRAKVIFNMPAELNPPKNVIVPPVMMAATLEVYYRNAYECIAY